jgi:hypothetical protein
LDVQFHSSSRWSQVTLDVTTTTRSIESPVRTGEQFTVPLPGSLSAADFLLVRHSIVLVLVSRVEPSKGRMHASSRTTISPISMSFFFPSMVYSSESSTARYLVFLRVFISRHIQALGTEVDESLCLLRMAAAAVRIARRRIGECEASNIAKIRVRRKRRVLAAWYHFIN